MTQPAFLAAKRASSLSLMFLAVLVPASATPITTPEPSSYAIGFGGAALGFVVWRNLRRARKNARKTD